MWSEMWEGFVENVMFIKDCIIVLIIGLLWLTVLTLLNTGQTYIGKTRRLSTIFVHSYREPEVVVTYLDLIK